MNKIHTHTQNEELYYFVSFSVQYGKKTYCISQKNIYIEGMTIIILLSISALFGR